MRLVIALIGLTFFAVSADAAVPTIQIVFGKAAPRIETQAAMELGSILSRLYGAEVSVGSALPANQASLILVGSPATNESIKKVTSAWPELSEQGHIVKTVLYDGKSALLIGGNSPAAVYWAAWEYAHQLGVRPMLYGDIDPVSPPSFTLDGFDIKLEPQLKSRTWQVMNVLPHGGESWGLEEQRRLIGQLAKLKFNRIVVGCEAWQPFVDFQTPKTKKQTGVLWYGWTLPVSGDTAGRGAFKGAKFFENPDFVGKKTYAERIQAGQNLVRGIIQAGHDFGMTAALAIRPAELPREFAAELTSPAPVPDSFELAVRGSAGQGTSELSIAKTQIEAYLKTYPEADEVILLPSADEAASNGSTDRLRQLIAENKTASKRVSPRGSTPVSVGDVSVLPKLDHSSLLNGMLGKSSDATVLQYWCVGDKDLNAYLWSRSAFDSDLKAREVCDELVTSICGEGVADRVWKGFEYIEAATRILNEKDRDLGRPAPDMVLKHYASDESPPAWWSEARDHYLNAMNEMYRANTRARDGGRSYTLYFARRFEFAFEYLNCIEATRKAGIAKRAKDSDTQAAELEKAIESMNGALNAMAAVARSNSDRGIIAVLNEFGYRPLGKELETVE